jgi:hypothetical protein
MHVVANCVQLPPGGFGVRDAGKIARRSISAVFVGRRSPDAG